MTLKVRLKSFYYDHSPLCRIHQGKMRHRLKNKNFTLLAPNCGAGILYHELGLPFLSPTINLSMDQKDFLKFIKDLDHYTSEKLRFVADANYNFPCAWLDDIYIRFVHYDSRKDAAEKWYSRCKRINKDNIYFYMLERNGITEKDLIGLDLLPYNGGIVFTNHEYANLPFTVFCQRYENQNSVQGMLDRNHINGSMEMESVWDFVDWLNPK